MRNNLFTLSLFFLTLLGSAPLKAEEPLQSPRLILFFANEERNEISLYLEKELGALCIKLPELEGAYPLLSKLDLENENHLYILDCDISGKEDEALELARSLGYDAFIIAPTVVDAHLLLAAIQEKMRDIPTTSKDLPHMDPITAGKLYGITQKVDGIFRENDLFYWSICGTLLGNVRHEGLIPWDDDVDVSIYEEDVPKLLSLEEALAKENLALCTCSGYFKIYDVSGECIPMEDSNENYPWKFPFIDVFPFSLVDGKVSYASERLRNAMGFKDYFDESQLTRPLQEIPFGPLLLPAPHRPKEYLDRLFGSDWSRIAYADYCHREEKTLKKVKVTLVDHVGPDYIMPGKG